MHRRTVTPDNLSLYCHSNMYYLKEPIRGILINFHGLNFTRLVPADDVDPQFIEAANRGILYLYPYDGAWSWMNFEAIRLVDELVDAVWERYSLPESTPIVTMGGSMGGLSCLIYSRYAKRTPIACAPNCPVCDLPFHYTERPDLPRTMYSAFAHYSCGMEEALKLHSPLHQAVNMPMIPYLLVHGEADEAVNIDAHAVPFVEKMQETGHDITYIAVPGMTHCDLDHDPAVKKRYFDFIFGAFPKN